MVEAAESEKFLQRVSQKVFVVLAVVLLPALVASFMRALGSDGPYGVVALQLVMYVWVVILALPLPHINLRIRGYSVSVIASIIACSSVFSSADSSIASVWLLIAVLFLSLVTQSRLRYLFIAIAFPSATLMSNSIWNWAPNWESALGFGIGHAGLALCATLLIHALTTSAQKTAESERKLRLERDRALQQLQIEEQRRTAVSENANVAFFQFDYASGHCYGDRVELARHGLSPDAEFWDAAQDAHLFAPESQALLQSQIAELSQKPAGGTAQFVLQMRVQPSNELRSFRISGLNVEVDGKLQFVGTSIDISEEIQAIEKAKDLSGLIELVSGAGGVGLIEFFLDTRTFKCNSEVSARLGLEHSELERDIELFYAHQTEEIRALFLTPRQALAESSNGEQQSFVHPFYLANGELHYMRVSRIKREVHGRTSFLGLSLDITDEVQAKEQAERQAEQLNLLAMSGEVAYFEVDLERGLIDGNALLKQRAGLPADAPAFSMAEIVSSIPVEARAEFEANVQRAIEAGLGGVTTFEHPYYKHDGELIYVRVTATTQMRHGRLHALGASVEITEAVQARQQAEKQADHLSLLALGGKVAFFEVDLARGMVDGNAVLKQRFGLPASAGGFSMEQLVESIPLDARDAFQKNVQNANEAGVGAFTVFEHPQYKYDGELIYVRVTATIILRHGHMYVQGSAVEITEAVAARKQAEQQADQLKLITEQGKIGLYEFDLEKGVIHANSVMCERFGVDPELGEISQEVMLDNLAEEARGSALEHIERGKTASEGYFGTSTVDNIFSDGSVHKIRIFEKLERRQGRPFYVGAGVDVTDEVQAREQAEAAMSKLAQEQDRQAQMYAVIGHELRTPAASLQMMLDDLAEGETLDSVLARANIEQLLSVIDTLRAVAQPERLAQSSYDDVQLDEMLQQQAQNFQSMATRHGIQLKTDFTELTIHPVHIQKTLLRQVVSNLIKNALIHSGGTQLEVGASGRLLEGGRKAVRLWIADNGQGVSADKVEKLFEAFVRGSTEAEGTGLGLHICREIIQNMGGELRYEPRPEGGACFVIELEVDLAKAEPSEPRPDHADESALKGMRVLVAEDNKTIQMLTQKMLTKQGAEVRVCSDGREALEAFEPGKFDLVLSDIFMPEMNGYELASEIRRVDTAVPLIGLTAATIGKETDEMLAAGASAVLSKPINLSKLIDLFAKMEASQNPA